MMCLGAAHHYAYVRRIVFARKGGPQSGAGPHAHKKEGKFENPLGGDCMGERALSLFSPFALGMAVAASDFVWRRISKLNSGEVSLLTLLFLLLLYYPAQPSPFLESNSLR